jgi:hypothetical protein
LAAVSKSTLDPARKPIKVGASATNFWLWQRSLRPDGLTLWTFQRNAPARRFYEARGFVGSVFTDGSRNEEREPDALYTWLPRGSSGSA